MARHRPFLPGCLLWPLAVAAALVSCSSSKPAPAYPCGLELIELQAERASERRTIIQSGACSSAFTVAECPALREMYERWKVVFDRWEACR